LEPEQIRSALVRLHIGLQREALAIVHPKSVAPSDSEIDLSAIEQFTQTANFSPGRGSESLNGTIDLSGMLDRFERGDAPLNPEVEKKAA